MKKRAGWRERTDGREVIVAVEIAVVNGYNAVYQTAERFASRRASKTTDEAISNAMGAPGAPNGLLSGSPRAGIAKQQMKQFHTPWARFEAHRLQKQLQHA